MKLPSFPLVVALAVALAACTSADPNVNEPAPPDDEEGRILTGKADGGCLAVDSDEIRGVLSLVNDPKVDVDLLDKPAPEGVGLYSDAAKNLVAARPIEDIEALDAVPQVGPATCRALKSYACERAGLCEAPLNIVSWNVESFPLTADAAAAVVETVRELDADLVGLQEIKDTDAFDDLLEDLPEYRGIVGSKGYYTRVAILYRPDRLTVEKSEALFEDDWYAFPRPPLAVTFSLQGRAASSLLSAVVVHLKAQIDAESEERRRVGIERLDMWADEHAAAVTPHLVLLGDFNDGITDPAEHDVFAPLRDGDYELLTQPLAEDGDYSYIPFKKLIDHVIISRAASALMDLDLAQAYPAETVIDYYPDRVSDHRPVHTRHIPILPAE